MGLKLDLLGEFGNRAMLAISVVGYGMWGVSNLLRRLLVLLGERH
jgi:hypothetical protein